MIHIDTVAYEAALALQREQPRCDLTIPELPPLGVLNPQDQIAVSSNGQTYAVAAALFANIATAPTGIYNVLTYGAAESNTGADNQIAFQLCINACLENGGGLVLIPNGTYAITGGLTVSSTALNSQILITGESRFGAKLIQQISANTFTITNFSGTGFQNLSVQYASTSLTGTAFYTNSSHLPGAHAPGNNQNYYGVQVVNASIGFYFFETGGVYLNDTTVDSGSNNIANYWLDGGSYGTQGIEAANLTNCIGGGDSINGVGLLIGFSDTLTCVNCQFENHNNGIEIGSQLVVNNPDRVGTIANPIQWPIRTVNTTFVGGFSFDHNTHGCYVHPPGPPAPTSTPGSWAVVDLRMSSMWMGSNGTGGGPGNGLYFAADPATSSSGTISGVQLTGIGSVLNGKPAGGGNGSGLVIESGATYTITGCFFSGNLTYGILLDASNFPIDGVNITGVTCVGYFAGQTPTQNHQNAGIKAINGPTNVFIQHANVINNDTEGISPDASGGPSFITEWGFNCIIKDCPGFTPQGFTLTNRPFAFNQIIMNPYPIPVQVYVQGDGVTHIALQTGTWGTTTIATTLQTVFAGSGIDQGTYRLEPSDGIAVSGSGDGSWNWQGV